MKNNETYELPELTEEEVTQLDELTFTAGGSAWWL
ncbi:hypothetical protein DFP97_12243 [Paenibacillus prosopidis]|uniref:Uncharacterized protein n=1 Tax=Paenibacillus prosopidis TaxID=630520 RepID=A0A368VQP8_9BACL|nr:hypothetical protein DFP97_12243 [Paenibacillus prosopidis]